MLNDNLSLKFLVIRLMISIKMIVAMISTIVFSCCFD